MEKEFLNFKKLLEFNPDEGMVTFRGNRMLLFHAEALYQLREELIRTLGEDIARGVLIRFGYRCGYNDALSLRNMYKGRPDAEWMLAGPKTHTNQGLVHVTNQTLEFDRKEGKFLMKGLWHNSFEADQHLKRYGVAEEAVCWTLTGYASGYGSGFMGQEVVCVETKCQAKGDSCCAYEMRNVDDWGELAEQEKGDLKPNLIVKSLQRMLTDERERVLQWRALNESAVILNSQLDSEHLPEKFIDCAKKLVFAEQAMLALQEEGETKLIIYKKLSPEDPVIKSSAAKPKGAIEVIFQRGVSINRDTSHFSPDELYGFSKIKKNLLGVPLYAKGKVIGALLMANKQGERAFNEDDEELLTILGSQMGIALENSRLYEKIDEKLQSKAGELEQVNKDLSNKHQTLLKSLKIHQQLTEIVLSDKGIEAICKTLSEVIGNPVQVEDYNLRLLVSTENRSKKRFLTTRSIMDRSIYYQQAEILREEKKPVEIPLGNNSKQYLAPIMAGKQMLGFISTVSVNKKLKQLDKVALEHGATVIALEMLKQKAAYEHNMRLKENFVEDLLAGDFHSEEVMYHRATQLELRLQDIYQVLLVDVEPQAEKRSKIEIIHEIRELIKELAPSSVAVNRNNQVLVLVTQDEKKTTCAAQELAELIEQELHQLLGKGRWLIALGTSCDKLEEINQSYSKAVITLEVMKALHQENKISNYNKLGIFAFLEINPNRFIEFTQRVLGPLIEYEQKKETQLINTLKLYYKNNGNILKAARNGYLNPSTMKYRLRRIQEITGLDLKDPEVGLQVQLALKLIDQQ